MRSAAISDTRTAAPAGSLWSPSPALWASASAACSALSAAFLRGVSFTLGEPGYDAARIVFNRIVDRRPALIARCAGAADVIACVGFAHEHNLAVSVRGGRHSIAGKAI